MHQAEIIVVLFAAAAQIFKHIALKRPCRQGTSATRPRATTDQNCFASQANVGLS
jgi:hypothetical protein